MTLLESFVAERISDGRISSSNLDKAGSGETLAEIGEYEFVDDGDYDNYVSVFDEDGDRVERDACSLRNVFGDDMLEDVLRKLLDVDPDSSAVKEDTHKCIGCGDTRHISGEPASTHNWCDSDECQTVRRWRTID